MSRPRLPKKYRNGKDACLRDCLAKLLRRRRCDVPHFVGLYAGKWHHHLADWLAKRGYSMILTEKAIIWNVRQWINIGVTKAGASHAVLVTAALRDRRDVQIWDGGNPLRRVQRSLVIWRKR